VVDAEREPETDGGWDPSVPGALVLPSGRVVRGRGLRRAGLPPGPAPEFGLYLLARQPPTTPWPSRWVRWPDFGLPRDRDDARDALVEAWQRAERERVEIACGGGLGRTGTALACLVALEGRSGAEAVDYVRQHYHRRAVETVWQRRYVAGFDPGS
jgi:hypothetical protein